MISKSYPHVSPTLGFLPPLHQKDDYLYITYRFLRVFMFLVLGYGYRQASPGHTQLIFVTFLLFNS